MPATLRNFLWPAIGIAAVIFSGWLLYRELHSLSLATVWESLSAIPLHQWALAVMATLIAYVALSEYDRIALIHLGRRMPWHFVMVASFTTYALSHNIGASVISGTVVRIRAYGSQGLSGGEIGVLVGLTSFTFIVGSMLIGGLTLLIDPSFLQRFIDLPEWTIRLVGVGLLLLVALYALGSVLKSKPVKIFGFQVYYPSLGIVIRQLIVGPVELMGAAAIIYFCLPAASNPGFITILGIFVASFCLALISHAPGGLGVIEYLFLTALSDSNQADVLAALIAFRIFYLVIPLVLALIVVLVFERGQFAARRRAASLTRTESPSK